MFDLIGLLILIANVSFLVSHFTDGPIELTTPAIAISSILGCLVLGGLLYGYIQKHKKWYQKSNRPADQVKHFGIKNIKRILP